MKMKSVLMVVVSLFAACGEYPDSLQAVKSDSSCNGNDSACPNGQECVKNQLGLFVCVPIGLTPLGDLGVSQNDCRTQGCPSGQFCTNDGRCISNFQCGTGLTNCGNFCANLQTDSTNCGACGVTCGQNTQCQGGHCTLVCTGGTTQCGNTCVNISADFNNCGVCGHVCGQGTVCQGGNCIGGGCTGGTTNCNGACVNLATDTLNCGSCGIVCSLPNASAFCANSSCQYVCQQGFTRCNNACVNVAADGNNCGSCGRVCDQGSTCQNGSCTVVCGGGLTACGNACTNLQVDSVNCGACGRVCGQGNTCQGGVCALQCAQGLNVCGNACVNLATDWSNCGSCGHLCPQGQVCQGGVCNLQCGGGTTNCNGDCANLQTDNANCGACGHLCAQGQNCQGGVCQQVNQCGGNLTACNNACVNVLTDPANCGKCAVVCGQNMGCNNGICMFGCGIGYTNCGGGICADTQVDQKNCGKCGNACRDSEMCQGGACVACGGNRFSCGNVCVDLNSDAMNCGKCGIHCAQGEVCTFGVCGLPPDFGVSPDMAVIQNCGGGLSLCNNACVDLSADKNNCGKCSKVCDQGFDVWCYQGACSNKAPIGGKCGSHLDCQSDLCETFTFTCSEGKYGDRCQWDFQCRNNLKCTNDNYCGGQPDMGGFNLDAGVGICDNGRFDVGETDTDCGGVCNAKGNLCWPGKRCAQNADCVDPINRNNAVTCQNSVCTCPQGKRVVQQVQNGITYTTCQ